MDKALQDQGNIFAKSAILIADDLEPSQRTLSHILEGEGCHNIRTVSDGVKIMETLKGWLPDLIIIDVTIPRMDGNECLKRLKDDEYYRHIPVIIQTVSHDPDNVAEVFELGACDYIIKPVCANEVIARCQVHLERNDSRKCYHDYHRVVQDDLSSARQMQNILMPLEHVIDRFEQNYQLNIRSFVKNSFEIGGDFWGIFGLDDDHIAVYLVDFSGHGIAAALNTFRLHAVMMHYKDLAKYPEKFIHEVNHSITPLLQVHEFATMFYGIIDTKRDCLRYVTAANPIPLIIREDTRIEELNMGRGLALGMNDTSGYKEMQVPFFQGDALFLYSDALTETKDSKGGYLDLKDLKECIGAAAKRLDDQPERNVLIFDDIVSRMQNDYFPQLEDDLSLNMYSRTVVL